MPSSNPVFASRRSFLRGCGLVVVGSVLAACAAPASAPPPGSTSAAPPPTAASTTPPAAAPTSSSANSPTAAPATASAANLSGEVTFSDPAALQAGSGDVIKRMFAAFQKTYPNVTVRDASL